MANVLIVDDQVANRELVATLAGYMGHQVHEAANGEDALAIARQTPPDLVICDILMPVMDGYELVRRLRADPALAAIRVVFYTANYQEGEARNLVASLGVTRVLYKPCVPEDILAAIEEALGEGKETPESVDQGAFGDEHRRVLTDVLARKAEELEKANRRLAALTEINLQLSSLLDADTLLQRICRDTRSLIGARYAVLCMQAQHTQGQDMLLSSHGFTRLERERLPRPVLDQGPFAALLQQRKPYRFTNPGGRPEDVGLPARFPKVKSGLAVPVMSAAKVYGWLCLINKLGAPAFSQEDEWLCNAYAALAGQVYANCSLYLQLERRAKELQLYDRAIEESSNGIVICRSDRQADNPIIYANQAFAEMTGYGVQEVLGRSPRFLLQDDWEQPDIERLRGCMRGGRSARVTLRNYRKDGSRFWNEVAIAAVHSADDVISHYISVFNDVTERKLYEEALEYQANHDALTGLANRNLLSDRLEQAINKAKRTRSKLAVMLLDLDQFKRINDSLGHGVGDALLKEIANRLTDSLRMTDTVARLGGDEFMVISGDLRSERKAADIASKMLAQLEAPVTVENHRIVVSASLGVAIYPKDGNTAEELLRNADTAMYRAKEQGRNGYQFYAMDMNSHILDRLALEADLRLAVERGELELFYQPKLVLPGKQVVGAEALIRWRHPTRGLVSPAVFIPVAEDTGLILPIGNWVIEEACRQLKRWDEQGLAIGALAVNISAHQFRQADLAQQVLKALKAADVAPQRLQLEVTETAIMNNPEAAISSLQRLREQGLCIALDDFGTGYSSLNYLKRFPIDILKIDQSFVCELPTEQDSAAIVEMLIHLAQQLGLAVVAEGVETEAQLQFLCDKDCDQVQGYLFSPPVPAADFVPLVTRLGMG